MKLKTNGIFESFHDKILVIFIVLSMLFCVYYTVIFLTMSAFWAAIVQGVGILAFGLSLGLVFGGGLAAARWISVGSSYFLILIQNYFFFGKDSGFHFMYLPLLVVAYTVFSGDTRAKRTALAGFSLLLAVTFLFLQNSSLLLMQDYLPDMMNSVFFYSSIMGTFFGLFVVLFYFSKELWRARSDLQILASQDPLTGISNRREFMAHAEEQVMLSRRDKGALSVLMIDIDRFKAVNDLYGHMVGDQAIKEVAAIIKRTIRESDLCARFGGEEFAVLLPATNESSALLVAEKIRTAVESNLFDIGRPNKIQLTVSIGIATLSQKLNTLDGILSKADIALYWSKENGRNRNSVYFEAL